LSITTGSLGKLDRAGERGKRKYSKRVAKIIKERFSEGVSYGSLLNTLKY